ncbi:hypothetical protein AB894_15345 [Piscirickettsia salmonis]|nr:hypothetical protein AB894_15345 [Piscirickettsia salmonis]
MKKLTPSSCLDQLSAEGLSSWQCASRHRAPLWPPGPAGSGQALAQAYAFPSQHGQCTGMGTATPGDGR